MGDTTRLSSGSADIHIPASFDLVFKGGSQYSYENIPAELHVNSNLKLMPDQTTLASIAALLDSGQKSCDFSYASESLSIQGNGNYSISDEFVFITIRS